MLIRGLITTASSPTAIALEIIWFQQSGVWCPKARTHTRHNRAAGAVWSCNIYNERRWMRYFRAISTRWNTRGDNRSSPSPSRDMRTTTPRGGLFAFCVVFYFSALLRGKGHLRENHCWPSGYGTEKESFKQETSHGTGSGNRRLGKKGQNRIPRLSSARHVRHSIRLGEGRDGAFTGGGGHDNGSFCSSYNLFLWSLWILARGIIRHVSNTASLLFLLYLVSLGLPKVNTTSVTTAVPKPSIVDIQYHVGSTCQKSINNTR